MQKIRYLIIALMCMVVQGALAQEPTWTEVGDADAWKICVNGDENNLTTVTSDQCSMVTGQCSMVNVQFSMK